MAEDSAMSSIVAHLLSVLALFANGTLCSQGTAPKQAPLSSATEQKLRAAFGEALASSDAGDWSACLSLARSLETKHARSELLAVLVQGPERERGMPKARKVGKKKEELEEFERVTSGYAFVFDGRTYRYAVDVPRSYDGEKPCALLVDPGHGSGAELDARGKADFVPFFRARVEDAGFEDWLVARTEIVEQVGAGGKAGALPEDQVAAIFAAFRRDLLTRFAVDPARVYVTGLSQTGFWAWYLGRELGDRLAGIAPMGAVTWQVDKALENLLTLPTFVLHGENDKTCPVAQPRATTQRMQALGLPVKYLEVAGAAHDFGTWSHLGDGLAWLAAQPRASAPARVVKGLGTLANPWAHWLKVEKLSKESDGRAGSAPTARVEARIEGRTIEVQSEGVEALSLWLSEAQLDLESELEVRWNGKTVFQGKPERSFTTAVQAALERCDWVFLPEARIELE
jgi:dienelactone hydrolase